MQILFIGLVQFSRSTEARTATTAAGGLSKLSSVPSAIETLGSPVDVLEKSP